MGPDHRRTWLFPPVTGSLDDIDLALLDPADEDERRLLIEAEHPELADAIAGEVDEIVADGHQMSPRLHLAMHELVANQLWSDDPPELWPTAERLIDAGYERHEVLHMLGSVAAGELWRMTNEKRLFDRDRYAADLDALPESWEDWREAEAEGTDADTDEDDGWAVVRPPDGTTFTHLLTDEEVAGGFVAYGPDLDVLDDLLADHGHLHIVGGAVAELEHHEGTGGVLVGPPGWLGAARPGDLVGFRLEGDEAEVVPVTATAAAVPDGLRDALRAAFDRLNEADGMPVPAEELVGAALTELSLPTAAVLPPLGGLLADAGFEVRDGYVALDGADWAAFGRLRAAAAIASIHGLDPDGATALVALAEMYRLFADGRTTFDEVGDGVVEELTELLGDPELGPAFAELVAPGFDDQVLAGFAAALLARAPRRHRAGPAWLGSFAAGRAGDHGRADVLRREALDADPEHWPSLEDSAWDASDSGDARRAIEMLGRLGELGDIEAEARVEVLRPYAHPPRALARRNDPCPCGSGRKHSIAAWARRGRCRCPNGPLDLGEARLVPVPRRLRGRHRSGFQVVGGVLPVPLRLRDPLLAALDAGADASSWPPSSAPASPRRSCWPWRASRW